MAQSFDSSTFSPSLSNLTDASERILRSTIDTLLALRLEEIDDRWVEEVWSSQFTEAPELDDNFESVHDYSETSVLKLIEKATEFAQKWLKFIKKEDLQLSTSGMNQSQLEGSFSSRSSFWSSLIQDGVKYKALIALLFYYMENGQRMEATSANRKYCLKSASLYFVLLGIPGSGAFKIFHPVLYNKALDTFKMALKLHLVKQSPKKKPKNKRSQGSQGVPRKRSQFSRASSTGSGISDLLDSDSDEEDGTLTPQEVSELTYGLSKVLFSFLTMLDHCPLKRSQESLFQTVVELVELTHLETGFANLDFNHRLRRSDLSSLAFNAYVGLEKLCAPIHGSVIDNVKLIFQHLLPGILMTYRGSSEISPKGLQVIREHSLHFIKHLMVKIGDESHEAVQILIQHIAMKVPERAEYRHGATSAIITLMTGLPDGYYSITANWFFRLAHVEKSANRLFALEVMGKLLAENEREKPRERVHGDHDYGNSSRIIPEEKEVPDDQDDQPQQNESPEPKETETDNESEDKDKEDERNVANSDSNFYSSHKFLFGVIFSRCKDSSALVRAKALNTLADVTSKADENPIIADVIYSLFDPNMQPSNSKKTVDFADLLQNPDADISKVNPLPKSDEFIDFLRKRALDDSVFVRKHALQVLVNILRYYSSHQTQDLEESALDLVSILSEHCRDPSVMVRKQIITSLTDLLRAYPDNDFIISKWVEGIFPLILDVEQKAAEKVLEAIWDVLFNNIVPYAQACRSRHFLPWKILNATEKMKMTSYLSRACGQWAKDQMLKPSLFKSLKSHIDTENSNAAWLLMALVTGHVPLQDPQYVMEYFNNSIHTPEGVGLYTLLQVLRVLLASVSKLSEENRASLQKDLLSLVRKFMVPPELISTAIDIASIVSWLECGGQKDSAVTPKKMASSSNIRENYDGAVNLKLYHHKLDDWAIEIIDNIDQELGKKILQPDGTEVEDTRMTRQIFTLGELAQICPHRINKRLFLIMQSIIFQQGIKRKRKDLPSSQTQSNDPIQINFKPTTKLQALSVITLAKMCLQNEDMAKTVVPAFGHLLDTTKDPALKNNIMYALSDMCVRYASLVDPLMPQMTACLKDLSLVVRRTTLTTLIHLLQEDYIKMTSGIFFRILQTLCDEYDEIKDLTTFYIQQRLLKRKPKTMYNNFVESLFNFNGYEGHESYNKNKAFLNDRDKALFNLSGKKYRDDRMKLYKFMLEHMSDEYRFQTTHKLCQDVLNGCVEGSVKLNAPNAHELLQDTLACLASEEIKLASLKSKSDVDQEIDPNAETTPENMAGAVLAAAKKTIISQVVKKNVIENIIPIVIALKHRLEKLKSPLLDDLMTYLRELMKDYKNEVKEILAADKQLATEIQFDLKKWEEEMEARKAREEEEEAEENDAQKSRNQEQLLREVLLTAINKKRKDKDANEEDGDDDDYSPDSKDKKQKRKVIENLIELSLPRPKRRERRATSEATSEANHDHMEPLDDIPEDDHDMEENDEGADDQAILSKAVADLSPKVSLKRVKDKSPKDDVTGEKNDKKDDEKRDMEDPQTLAKIPSQDQPDEIEKSEDDDQTENSKEGQIDPSENVKDKKAKKGKSSKKAHTEISDEIENTPTEKEASNEATKTDEVANIEGIELSENDKKMKKSANNTAEVVKTTEAGKDKKTENVENEQAIESNKGEEISEDVDDEATDDDITLTNENQQDMIEETVEKGDEIVDKDTKHTEKDPKAAEKGLEVAEKEPEIAEKDHETIEQDSECVIKDAEIVEKNAETTEKGDVEDDKKSANNDENDHKESNQAETEKSEEKAEVDPLVENVAEDNSNEAKEEESEDPKDYQKEIVFKRSRYSKMLAEKAQSPAKQPEKSEKSKATPKKNTKASRREMRNRSLMKKAAVAQPSEQEVDQVDQEDQPDIENDENDTKNDSELVDEGAENSEKQVEKTPKKSRKRKVEDEVIPSPNNKRAKMSGKVEKSKKAEKAEKTENAKKAATPKKSKKLDVQEQAKTPKKGKKTEGKEKPETPKTGKKTHEKEKAQTPKKGKKSETPQKCKKPTEKAATPKKGKNNEEKAKSKTPQKGKNVIEKQKATKRKKELSSNEEESSSPKKSRTTKDAKSKENAKAKAKANNSEQISKAKTDTQNKSLAAKSAKSPGKDAKSKKSQAEKNKKESKIDEHEKVPKKNAKPLNDSVSSDLGANVRGSKNQKNKSIADKVSKKDQKSKLGSPKKSVGKSKAKDVATPVKKAKKVTEKAKAKTSPKKTAKKSGTKNTNEKKSDNETSDPNTSTLSEMTVDSDEEISFKMPSENANTSQNPKKSSTHNKTNLKLVATNEKVKASTEKLNKSGKRPQDGLVSPPKNNKKNRQTGKVQNSKYGKSPRVEVAENDEKDDNAWEDLPETEKDKSQNKTKTPKKCQKAKASKVVDAKKQKLRAISTPNKNETFLKGNVTFMDRSDMADISAIPVLSPPTVKRRKRLEVEKEAKKVNEASFQFRNKRGRNSDEQFDLLVSKKKKIDNNKAGPSTSRNLPASPKVTKSKVANVKTSTKATDSPTRSGRTPKKNPKYND